MTDLQSIKDEVAKEQGYKELDNMFLKRDISLYDLEVIIDTIAKRFAQEMLKETIENIKDIPEEFRTSKSAIECAIGKILSLIKELQ